MFISCLWCITLVLWLELHGFGRVPPCSSVDVQQERDISGQWTSADSLRWLDISEMKWRWLMSKKKLWSHQWPSMQSCSLNWCFNENTGNKESHLVYWSQVEIWDTPQRHSLFTISTTSNWTFSLMQSCIQLLQNLINSVEALRHRHWCSHQHGAH